MERTFRCVCALAQLISASHDPIRINDVFYLFSKRITNFIFLLSFFITFCLLSIYQSKIKLCFYFSCPHHTCLVHSYPPLEEPAIFNCVQFCFFVVTQLCFSYPVFADLISLSLIFCYTGFVHEGLSCGRILYQQVTRHRGGGGEETRNLETYFKPHHSTTLFLERDGEFLRKKYMI